MKDNQTKKLFIEYRAKGWSYSRIAKKLRIGKCTLVAWGDEFCNEISTLWDIEFEAICETFCLERKHRIKLLGSQLLRIRDELNKRSLDSLTTLQLFELLGRYSLLLKEDYMNVENAGLAREELANAMILSIRDSMPELAEIRGKLLRETAKKQQELKEGTSNELSRDGTYSEQEKKILSGKADEPDPEDEPEKPLSVQKHTTGGDWQSPKPKE